MGGEFPAQRENMKEFTVATYNILHGHNVDFDWDRIAEVAAQSGADVIGFQEIDMGTNRVGGRDTVSGLIQATGLSHALFVPAMNYDGGQYGTAILSRFPIAASEGHSLDSGGYEPRAFGCVTVSLDGDTPLYVLNTHLSCESHAQQKIQFEQLAAWMDTRIPKDAPVILTGDFNTDDFSAFDPLKALGLALVNDEGQRYKTFRHPPAAIDNIVYRQDLLSPVAHGMIDSDRSDHNLLWCRFQME